jgi:alanine-glyoxylate transaminase/serine-glyoxylate transaminase/serine-pyruvate transaminase
MRYPPPEIQHLDNMVPSETLLLMGQVSVPISHTVACANVVVSNHLGETIDEVIRNVKIMWRYEFQTVLKKIIGLSGLTSAVMEMEITKLLWPGRCILVLSMGTFSGRMAEMSEGVGVDVTVVESEGIQPLRIE